MIKNLLKSAKDAAGSVSDSVSSTAKGAADSVSNKVKYAKDAAGSLSDSVSSTAKGAVDSVSNKAKSTLTSAGNMLDSAQAVVGAASTVKHVMGAVKVANTAKRTVDAVLHPVEWVRDQVKSWLIGVVKATLMLVVKEAVIDGVCERVEGSAYQKEFSIEPPETIKKYVYTEDGIAFLNNTAAIVFNEPLFALGMKLGRIHFAVTDENKLGCVFELRVHSTKTELAPLVLATSCEPQ